MLQFDDKTISNLICFWMIIEQAYVFTDCDFWLSKFWIRIHSITWKINIIINFYNNGNQHFHGLSRNNYNENKIVAIISEVKTNSTQK